MAKQKDARVCNNKQRQSGVEDTDNTQTGKPAKASIQPINNKHKYIPLLNIEFTTTAATAATIKTHTNSASSVYFHL